MKLLTQRIKTGWIFSLGVLLLFSVGFLVMHAREASNSGSWDYVINHDDEYSYWVFAQGVKATPKSETNPFYYEDRGKNHLVPTSLTAAALGVLAKIFGIPVLFFYPAWKILMPFLLWFTAYACLTRLWSYPSAPSAAIALLVISMTLFVHGSVHFTLLRFPRPLDGLWAALLWISLVMNSDRRLKGFTAAVIVTGILAMLAHPVYAVLGMGVTLGEGLWAWGREKNRGRAQSHAWILAALVLAATLYAVLIMVSLPESPSLSIAIGQRREVLPPLNMNSIVLFLGVLAAVLGFRFWTGSPVSRLDRLMLMLFLCEPLFANSHFLLGKDYRFVSHRYYFFVLEIFCLLGWFVEKVPVALSDARIRKFFPVSALIVFGFEAWVLSRPELNYFLHLPRQGVSGYSFTDFDNALLLLLLLPVLACSVGCVFRYARLRLWFGRKIVVIPLLTAIVISGFAFHPSQLAKFNRNFPFGGAYHWLRLHASPNEVVLTIPPRRLFVDYLLLWTDQKSYLNSPFGQRLATDPVLAQKRTVFYAKLLLGFLGRQEWQGLIAQPPRLDYILLELPSPFFDRVVLQLQDYLDPAYRDQRCVLWRVRASSS